MYTNRIQVFHITNGDAVACTVTHYFVLDFFPSGDTSFYQNLAHTGKTQTIFQDLDQFRFVMSDTTAASTQRISRTKNNRITDRIGKCNTVLYGCNHQGSCNRFTDFFHGIFEFLTIFCFFNCLGSSTDQSYIMFF